MSQILPHPTLKHTADQKQSPTIGRAGGRRAASAILAAAAVGAAFVASAGCDNAASKGAGMPSFPPAAVAVVKATQRDVPVYLDEIGKCAAREIVMIVPRVAGRITDVHFIEGSEVKKGDLLVEIDRRPFEAALKQVEAVLAQNRAQLDLAKLEFARAQSLVGIKATSPQDFDAKKSAVAVNEALVAANEAAAEIARLNLEYCEIRSPIDGRTGQRLVDVGNVVKENEGTLLVIQRQDPIYADFTITENDLAAVRSNMARQALKAFVWTPGDGGTELAIPPSPGASTRPASASQMGPVPDAKSDAMAPITPPHPASGTAAVPPSARIGQLTFLDNAVQDGSGTVKLRVSLENGDRHFWPGQFVFVRLVLDEAKGAVLVPATAIQVGQKGPFVYEVTDKSTSELRPVQLGQRQGDMVVIRSGVASGERVVTDGQMAVMPGFPVRVDSEDGVPVTPPAPGAAPGAVPAKSPAAAPATRPAAMNALPQLSGKGGES